MKECLYYCHKTKYYFGPWWGIHFGDYIKITAMYEYSRSWFRPLGKELL